VKYYEVAMEVKLANAVKPQYPGAMWRLSRVEQETGLMKSTLYKLMAQGKFVPSVKISDRCVAWPSTAVIAWCEERISASQKA
jgi:prophage regulatory protein